MVDDLKIFDWKTIRYSVGIIIGLFFLIAYFYWNFGIVYLLGSIYFFAYYTSKILIKFFGKKGK